MNWVDLLIGVGLAMGAIVGWMRGFIGMCLGVIGYLAALILAVLGAGPLAAWAESRLGLGAPTRTMISSRLSVPSNIGETSSAPVSSEGLGEVLAETGLSGVLSKIAGSFLSRLWAPTLGQEPGSLAGFLIHGLAHLVLVSIAFLLIFLAVRFVAWGLSRGLTAALGRGVLGSLNRAAGSLLGIAQYAILIAVVAGVMTVLGALAPSSAFSIGFSESTLVPILLPVFAYLISFIGGGPGF